MDNKVNADVNNIKKCGKIGCEKEGKLRCPNCTKFKIEAGSYFCAQDCFKSYWATHKKIHEECKYYIMLDMPIEDSFPYSVFYYVIQGKLRPYKQEPRRKVPDKIMKPEYAVSGNNLNNFKEDPLRKNPRRAENTFLFILKKK